jgi:hypothetical protein
MFIILVIVVCSGWLMLLAARASLYNPAVWWQLGWSIMLLAHGILPFEYHYAPVTLKTLIVLSSALLAFNAGWLTALLLIGKQARAVMATSPRLHPSQLTCGILTVGTIAYCSLLIASSWNLSSTLESNLTDMAEIRDAFWDKSDKQAKDVGEMLLTCFRPLAVLAAISMPFFLTRRRTYLNTSIAASMGLLFESLSAGGRFLIAMIVFLASLVAVFVIYAERGVRPQMSNVLKHLPLSFRFVTCAMIACGLFSVAFFPYWRNPKVAYNVDYYINLLYSATISDQDLSERSRVALYGLGYLGDPIAKLTFFLERTSVDRWFALGSYSFHGLYKPWALVVENTPNLAEWRRRISDELLAAEMPLNPWSTGVRDLIIDFGLFGTVICLFVIGSLCSVWCGYAEGRVSWAIICCSACFNLWMFFMAFMNLSIVGPFFGTFLIIAFVSIITNCTSRP